MNISILYNHDIYSNEALNLLLPKLSSHQLSLFYSKAVGKSLMRDRRLEQLRFVEQSGYLTTYSIPLLTVGIE